MSGRVAARMAELGLELPPAHLPVANYVGARRSGDMVYVSGVGPTWGQEVRFAGALGRELDLEAGRQAARLTALNLLAQVAKLLDGELDRIRQCARLFGLVNAAAGFEDAHLVIDGASALMVELLGEAGRHARSVTSAPGLPVNIACEMDGIFRVA